jgi:hypothetical protein
MAVSEWNRFGGAGLFLLSLRTSDAHDKASP